MTANESRRDTIQNRDGISTRDLPDGGIQITISATREQPWAVPLFCACGGILSIVVGLHFLRSGIPGEFVPQTPVKLIMLGVLCVAIGGAVALIRAVTGAPRDVVIESWPGRLRVDRSIAGDRVVSTYTPDQISALLIEYNALYAETRMGLTQLVAIGKRESNSEAALFVARRLWQGREIETKTKRGRGNRLFITPQSDV